MGASGNRYNDASVVKVLRSTNDDYWMFGVKFGFWRIDRETTPKHLPETSTLV